jgi:hypothetical protein
VAWIAAQAKNAGVDQWMERLDASTENLREPGQFLNAAHGNAALAEQCFSVSSGEQLDAVIGESASEFNHTRFVEHADQRAHVTLGTGAPPGPDSSISHRDCSLSSAAPWNPGVSL